jgi:hypothetical protein
MLLCWLAIWGTTAALVLGEAAVLPPRTIEDIDIWLFRLFKSSGSVCRA